MMPPEPGWQLEIADLTITRRGRRVLHAINLHIGAGESVAIIGPNGSGKTTLLLAMLGLLRPTRGRITLNARPVDRLAPRARGRQLASVPQTLDYVPGLTVREVVATGRHPHQSPLRPPAPRDQEAVAKAIRECGLHDLAERPLHALSGGERQKTLVAAAFAQEARALLLDEPTSALDPAVQVELAGQLRKWLRPDRTLIVVSHDLHLPTVLCRRVVALRDGAVAFDLPASQALHAEQLEALYGVPFEVATLEGAGTVAVPRAPR